MTSSSRSTDSSRRLDCAAGLGGTEDVALAPSLEVEPRQLEAVGRRGDPVEAIAATELCRRVGDQQAEALGARRDRPGRAAGAAARRRTARRRGSPSPTRSATSTPTSITVVATSTSMLAGGERGASRRPSRRRAAGRAARRGGGRPAVRSVSWSRRRRATASGGRRRLLLVGARRGRRTRRRRCLSRPRSAGSSPPMRGHDDVRLVSLRDLLADPLPHPVQPVGVLARRHDRRLDRAAARPGARGGSRCRGRRTTVIATVRGIGVAVMTSTCGGWPRPCVVRAARCSTPKRCCSSTTTRPRSANCDGVLEQGVGADDDPGGCPTCASSSAAATALPPTATR